MTMVLWNIFSKPADRFQLSWSWVYEKIKPGMRQPEPYIPDIYFFRVFLLGKGCPQSSTSRQRSSLLILEEVTAWAVTHELRSRKKHPPRPLAGLPGLGGVVYMTHGLVQTMTGAGVKNAWTGQTPQDWIANCHTTSPSALLLPVFSLMSIRVPTLSPLRCRHPAPSQSHGSLLGRCPEATLSPKVIRCIQKTIRTIETTIYFIMSPTLYVH